MAAAPHAFLSYTRLDDEAHDGAITALRQRLELRVRAATGDRSFTIFQDIDGIEFGQHWPSRLDEALASARFLIPVLSPLFFRIEPCRDELARFLELERRAGRRDLILPIYLVETRVLERPALRAADPLAQAMHERQWRDWRPYADLPLDHADHRRAIAELAKAVAAAMERADTPAPSPPPPATADNDSPKVDEAADTLQSEVPFGAVGDRRLRSGFAQFAGRVTNRMAAVPRTDAVPVTADGHRWRAEKIGSASRLKPAAPSLYISYRREDSAASAHIIATALRRSYGAEEVFLGTEAFKPGIDYVHRIEQVLDQCILMLVIIGPRWLMVTDRSGPGRLDDPDDPVRLEIVAALQRGLRIIPVLVSGAVLPSARELPKDLQALARRPVHEISKQRWDHDLEQLIFLINSVT